MLVVRLLRLQGGQVAGFGASRESEAGGEGPTGWRQHSYNLMARPEQAGI